MQYFENQPTRLKGPECALLRKLMGRINLAGNQTSMFPVESAQLDEKIYDAPLSYHMSSMSDFTALL